MSYKTYQKYSKERVVKLLRNRNIVFSGMKSMSKKTLISILVQSHKDRGDIQRKKK